MASLLVNLSLFISCICNSKFNLTYFKGCTCTVSQVFWDGPNITLWYSLNKCITFRERERVLLSTKRWYLICGLNSQATVLVGDWNRMIQPVVWTKNFEVADLAFWSKYSRAPTVKRSFRRHAGKTTPCSPKHSDRSCHPVFKLHNSHINIINIIAGWVFCLFLMDGYLCQYKFEEAILALFFVL